MARLRSLADRRRLSVPLLLAALAAPGVLVDADAAGASPLGFVIEFTQVSAPTTADGPPTGHFSIDDSLLNTGSDKFIDLRIIPGFEVVDDDMVWRAPFWHGVLRIPPFGSDLLQIQGLEIVASNAIAELPIAGNDPRCLGVAVPQATTCQAAIGASYPAFGIRPWVISFFDETNLAVAQGTYSICLAPACPAPPVPEVPEPGTMSMLGIGMGVLIGMRPWRRASRS